MSESPARRADLGALTDAGTSTWRLIAELAGRVSRDHWAIVGGQMVAIHAAIAGVDPPRVTDDGDIVVDVRAHGRAAMRDVAAALVELGCAVPTSPDGVTRFELGRAKVDLLAPEGVGANVETVPPGHAVQAPGTTQALDRSEIVSVVWPGGQVDIRCPSLLGAIIAKSAGSREIVSLASDERLKHQQDLVFLLSLATNEPIEGLRAGLSPKDRRRLQRATDPLISDPTHRAWRAAPLPHDVAQVCRRLLS